MKQSGFFDVEERLACLSGLGDQLQGFSRIVDFEVYSPDLAIPFFGYKSHISIDRKFRLIRKWKMTDAAVSDGARLRDGLLEKPNFGKSVTRSRVEHVSADQKSRTGLFVRTVDITRATMRVGLVNIVYNMRRCPLLERISAAA